MIQFVAGCCASFILGLLVAPRSGKETRELIVDHIKGGKK